MAESEAPVGPPPEVPSGTRVLIVTAPFYREIADLQISGAKTRLKEAGAEVEIAQVPGALEIPGAVLLAAQSGRFQGYVALGCVIRGETTHYETVCEESARGLMDLTLRGLAIGNGILTVETRKQAVKRADPERLNKGAGAADAALALIALRTRWGAGAKPAAEPAANSAPNSAAESASGAEPETKGAPGGRKSSFGPDSEHIVVAEAPETSRHG